MSKDPVPRREFMKRSASALGAAGIASLPRTDALAGTPRPSAPLLLRKEYAVPRFGHATFKARFPFGTVFLSDEAMPLATQVTGWSPFTPGDADSSSLPVAALEYRFHNTSRRHIKSVFSFNTRNFLPLDGNDRRGVRAASGGFAIWTAAATPEQPWRDAAVTVTVDDPGVQVNHAWFRGGWYWPKGGALSLPFPYSDEVWTGIEYQVASHLMLMGTVNEGLEIVRTCRDRYDGRVRNPFDEYECGHWYARALSSYALLQGLSGARYDAVEGVLHLRPNIKGDFRAFLATATGYGTVGVRGGKPFVEVRSGPIDIKEIRYSAA